MSLLRRRMMMTKKPSGGGGLNITLYDGDNGQTGIDVYNYFIENGTPNAAEGYDWESTEMDNLLITGAGLVNQRVEYANSDWSGFFYFGWSGMSYYWYITLQSDGYLFMDYDD